MRQIRLNISDLFEIDPQGGDDAKDLAAITAHVLKHYAFLPKPIAVTVEGSEVVISFAEEPDAKKEEARRLADRAVKRASEGNYEKAIGIYKRVLELQPSFHSARRDLAMAYVEVGDVESATNHLIEVLRLDPKDAWSWVVLANLYIREKGDPGTGHADNSKMLPSCCSPKPNNEQETRIQIPRVLPRAHLRAISGAIFALGVRGRPINWHAWSMGLTCFFNHVRRARGRVGRGVQVINQRKENQT